jgi:sec-independent protein translocase protein TatC
MAHMPAGSSFQYTQVAEQFITNLKVGLFAALFLAAPVIFAQFWGFVAPGLYRHERKLVLPFVVLSSVFFAAGAAFCYYMVLPWGMNFFLSMGSEEVQANIRVAEYLSFVTKFILGFGIIFEMPLAIFFLARAGIVDHEGLARFRRYAVVLSFVVAMLLTPPDPGTQIALAIPMVLLYEVGVLTARLWGRPKPKAPAEAPSVDTRPKGPPE